MKHVVRMGSKALKLTAAEKALVLAERDKARGEELVTYLVQVPRKHIATITEASLKWDIGALLVSISKESLGKDFPCYGVHVTDDDGVCKGCGRSS
jgi:hypothetical protein